MSEVKTSKLSPRTASGTLTLGTSGDTFEVPSGVTVTNNGTVSGFGLFASYAIIADQKTQNTDGGTFTSGAWRTRDLNTEIADPDGIVSISSNQFTLEAGSYLIRWVCATYQTYGNQSRVYNITDSSVEGISQTIRPVYDGENSVGTIRVDIAGSKTFEIQHYCNTTVATSGFGYAANIGTEQYTVVEIYKEA